MNSIALTTEEEGVAMLAGADLGGARGVLLIKMAIGAGISATRSITREVQIADAPKFIRETNATGFVCLRVRATNPPSYRRLLAPAACRNRIRRALLGSP